MQERRIFLLISKSAIDQTSRLRIPASTSSEHGVVVDVGGGQPKDTKAEAGSVAARRWRPGMARRPSGPRGTGQVGCLRAAWSPSSRPPGRIAPSCGGEPTSRRRRCCAGTGNLVARRWTFPATGTGGRCLDRRRSSCRCGWPGESTMVIPQDRGGMPQARHPGVGDYGAADPAPAPARHRTTP